VFCFGGRLLTKGAAQENAAKKTNQHSQADKEGYRKRRTQTAASHKLKRYSALAQRSAHQESQPSKEELNVNERPPNLGSQCHEGET
jgi:hypothetical protein